MALIFDSRFRAIDTSGNAYSGAKLIVKEAGTSTDATIYTTAALSVELPNPVTSDTDGYFPQIFADEGVLLDLTLTTSADETLKTWEDVAALGENTATFTRDFTNARFKISASAGVVSLEAGPATGDDIGGDIRLGGWAGTQADTAEIDAAATSVTGTLAVIGAVATSSTLDTGSTITENAKKLPGVVYETTTPAAAAGIVIALTESPANVRAWLIEGIDVTMSATTSVTVTISYDSAATFKTGANDYAYTSRLTTTGASAGILSDPANTNGLIATSAQTPTNKLGRLNMTVTTVESGSGNTIVEGRFHAYDNEATPNPVMADFTIQGLGGYTRATHIKISVASGTITGTFRVIPQRGFGE